MVNDLLTRGKGLDLATKRFQVGDYLLCLPDYQQIMQWSQYFKIQPKDLVCILEGRSKNGLTIEDGRIIYLSWDIKQLGGMPSDNWVADLQISSIILSENLGHLECLTAPKLPSLRSLSVLSLKANRLVLSGCPGIEELVCPRIGLTELDLSSCQSLKYLNCGNNQLASLDLTGLESLEALDCSNNNLTRIDLCPSPRLESLSISNNYLTELDTLCLKRLERLACYSNKLSYDEFIKQNFISERFVCGGDYEIEEFDLSVKTYNALKLIGINCVNDLRQLSHEDIRGLKNIREKNAQEVIHMLEWSAPWTFTSKKEPTGSN